MHSNRSFLCLVVIAISLQSPRIKSQKVQIKLNETSSISQAVVHVIKKSYKQHSVYISMATVEDEHKVRQMDILNDVLTAIEHNARQLGYYSHLATTSGRYYNIFIIDSYKAFQLMYNHLEERVYDFTGYYLIVFSHISIDHYETMTKIFYACWTKFIVNVNILIEPISDTIEMYSYFPFTPFHCSTVTPVLVNRFIDGVMIYNNLFPEKIRNLHKCPLIVITWPNHPYIFIYRQEDGSVQFDGIEGRLIENLAVGLNFSMKLLEPNTMNNPRGLIFMNGTMTGSLGMLYEGKGDFAVGNYRYTVQRAQHFSVTYSYYQVPIVISVRQELSYASFERLLYPFKALIWLTLIFFLIVGVFVIVILQRFAKPEEESFVIGSKNLAPIYNMFVGAIGGQVNPLPRRNFARFILMVWLVGSSVLRGSYQGALYNFIRTETKKVPPHAIQEIIDEQYTVFMSPTAMDLIVNFQALEKVKQLSLQTQESDLYDIQQSNRKFAALCPADYVTHFNNEHFRNGVLYIVPERLFIQQVSILLRRSSYLTAVMNDMLLQFSSGGLIGKWSRDFITQKYSTNVLQSNLPKQFSNHQLAGAYQIYIIFMGCSCFIFFLELLSVYMTNVRNFFEALIPIK